MISNTLIFKDPASKFRARIFAKKLIFITYPLRSNKTINATIRASYWNYIFTQTMNHLFTNCSYRSVLRREDGIVTKLCSTYINIKCNKYILSLSISTELTVFCISCMMVTSTLTTHPIHTC